MKSSKKGALVAAAVAGLFVAKLAVAADEHGAAAGSGKEAAKVKCEGVNSCKGTGACGGASHSCAGKNECKGKGWVHTSSAAECTSKGGKVVAAK